MPFREKRAWISLVSTFGVWTFYFATMVERASAGRLEAGHVPGLFAACIVALICVQIELKATRLAFYTFGSVVAMAAMATPLASAARLHFFTADPTADALLLICNGILLAAVAAELVRSGGQIVQFRRAG